MQDVKTTHDGNVFIIQINRPNVRNAINKATADELRAAWLAFEADDSARVGILTGGDEVFCAGADLNDVAALAADIDSEHGALGFTHLSVTKPTIAAVAGYCVAGGLELACWCDLRIADETAVFGCFERRFSVPLVDAGTVKLPLIVGLGRALEMILTGRPVTAPEARHWGLVNEVVKQGDHLRRAIELGHLLAEFPQAALRNDRASVYEAIGNPIEKALEIEAAYGLKTIASGEATAGAQAFQSGRGRKGTFEQ